ncbi:MAG: cryptochrome/photolyase family protein [Flavobacteriales bacterium]|nr:cryptochrome/photolyase family protein [Flavobacteriales bacterium]
MCCCLIVVKKIRLVLGDQLNENHSWFKEVDDDCLYVLMEVRQETDYVKHHIQKILGIFAAMRAFQQTLLDKGHKVKYFKIGDKENLQSFRKNLEPIIKTKNIQLLEYQEPDEYRLDQDFKQLSQVLEIKVRMVSSEHFLSSRDTLSSLFGDKNFLMESFYRKMRKDHDILMEHNKPVSGKWNYDKENRKKLPKGHQPPAPIQYCHNLTEILNEINTSGISHFGNVDAKRFIWPINRDEALEVVNFFMAELLQHFGDFQDAMSTTSWSVYHSRISFAMNIKLISPKEVIDSAIETWKKNPDIISLSQVEGFVRQILGWREYMRGVYWAKMPDYGNLNELNHENKLPSWFWDGKTKMNCQKLAINQSLNFAYAHHIQRLMVTGNFALLAGVHPDEIDAWYLGIYIDAFEWVEITNTRGMSQFADGGIVGTKPYVASANYINKMGDYCNNCYYDKKEKFGQKACPLNSLYWNFYDLHRKRFIDNPRVNMMYRVWDKKDAQEKVKILEQAEVYLSNIDNL